MSAERKRGEPKIVPEIVHLNQEFPLFQPGNTHIYRPRKGGSEFHEFTSIKILETGFTPPLAFEVSAGDLDTHNEHAVTPFAPKQGYTFGIEDFDVLSRIEKVFTEEKFNNTSNWRNSPLKLTIGTAKPFHLESITDPSHTKIIDKLYGELDTWIKKNPSAIDIVKKLLLQVQFPNQSLAAAVDEITLHEVMETDDEVVLFLHSFFPVDTGPLPFNLTLTEGRSSKDQVFGGMGVQLPSDQLSLSRISGKFHFIGMSPSGDK